MNVHAACKEIAVDPSSCSVDTAFDVKIRKRVDSNAGARSPLRPGPQRANRLIPAVLGWTVGMFLAGQIHAGCPRFASASEGLPTEREWRTHPALGDVNGDGHLDLAALPRKGRGPGVWLGSADATWTPASIGLMIPGFTCGVGVDFADVNRDGHLDLGVADHCHGLFVYLGSASGVWTLGSSPSIARARNGQEDLAFGDLNQDGHPDIVSVGSTHGGFSVLFGDGRGGWKQAETGLPDRGHGVDVALGDINADGHLDIAAAFVAADPGPEREARRRIHVAWLSDGSGRFRSASKGLPDEGDFRSVALGDVDGDGFLDLAISGGVWPGRPPLLVYHGNGGRSWRPASGGHPESQPGVVFEGVALADFDRDGNLDLASVRHLDAGLQIWRGDGRGGWTACPESGLPRDRNELRGWGLTVGDVNRDGRLDIAAGFGRASAGSLEVWVQR